MDQQLKYQFKESEAAVESASYQRYTLDRGIDSSRTAQFLVEGQPDSFIDLSQCYLKTTLRVVKEDGSEIGANPLVFLTENYGSNLWSQVNISLNNTPLPSVNDYPYTALLIDILGSSPDARTSVQTPLAGFDIPNFGSSSISDSLGGTYVKAKAACAGSKYITAFSRIHSDFMMSCSQLLPAKINLSLTLTRSKDDFVLGADKKKVKDDKGKEVEKDHVGSPYAVEVQSVSLFVKRVQLSPEARTMVERGLASGGRLHYQRLHTLAFPCAMGTRSWNWHNCFNNIAPRRVFVALVNQESYHGSLSRASSYLESAGVSSVRFTLDGRDVMPEPYKCEFKYKDGKVEVEESDVLSAFAGLCRVIGNFSSPRDHIGLTYPYFVNGATIFAVDLDHSQGHNFAPGNFGVNIEFEEPTKDSYTVIVMGEYPKTIAFDSNRHVTMV